MIRQFLKEMRGSRIKSIMDASDDTKGQAEQVVLHSG